MTRIGVIGTGHIAAPMVRFLARKGYDIAVTRRNATVSAQLARECGVSVGDAQQVLDGADIVLLCLRPQHARPVLSDLRFRDDHRIVSAMAGISAADLASICAPATRFAQFIPLGYLEQGGCPLAGFGETDLLETLFAPENPVVPTETEAALNAHFAICAMVPGILDMMATGADWLGHQTNDAKSATFFMTQLVAGFLTAMNKDRADSLTQERDALATEGTISLQMTTTLRDGGAHLALEQALADINQRLTAKEQTHD